MCVCVCHICIHRYMCYMIGHCASCRRCSLVFCSGGGPQEFGAQAAWQNGPSFMDKAAWQNGPSGQSHRTLPLPDSSFIFEEVA